MLRFPLLFNFISPLLLIPTHFTPLTSHPLSLSHTPFKPSFYLPYNFQCTLYPGFRLSDVIHRWDDIWGLRWREWMVFPLPKAFNYLLLFLHSRYSPPSLTAYHQTFVSCLAYRQPFLLSGKSGTIGRVMHAAYKRQCGVLLYVSW